MNGLNKIEYLNSHEISADTEYSELLILGLIKGFTYEKKGLALPQLSSLTQNLLDIYDRNSEIVKWQIERFGDNGTIIARLINKNRPNNLILIKEKSFFSKISSFIYRVIKFLIKLLNDPLFFMK